VIRIDLDKDTFGWRPTEGMTDKHGNVIEDRVYTGADMNRKLVLERRDEVVAAKITEYLKATDRYAKTIVFCEDIDHAARMRQALSNANADICATQPNYVVQITGDNAEGKRELDNFIDPEKPYPVIATTSKLMSTGVDAQTCKLIVLDQNIKSMTLFKQIIGRGTRLREDLGKSWFTILDFKRATELFADPAFDGDPVQIYEPRRRRPHRATRAVGRCPTCHRTTAPGEPAGQHPGAWAGPPAARRATPSPRNTSWAAGHRGRGPRARAVPQCRGQAHHRKPARLHPHQPHAPIRLARQVPASLEQTPTAKAALIEELEAQGRADLEALADPGGPEGLRPLRPAAARGLQPAAADPARARPPREEAQRVHPIRPGGPQGARSAARQIRRRRHHHH
jgi:type I restriction enzyme R subunit